MAKLKGIYFSLDALIAASVLLALTGFLISYSERAAGREIPPELEQLHVSSIQEISEWNQSIESRRTVLGYIYQEYYEGKEDESRSICRKYFELDSRYGLYFVNSSENQRVCGDYTVGNQSISTTQTLAPNIIVNGTFVGPKTAIMVVPN